MFVARGVSACSVALLKAKRGSGGGGGGSGDCVGGVDWCARSYSSSRLIKVDALLVGGPYSTNTRVSKLGVWLGLGVGACSKALLSAKLGAGALLGHGVTACFK